MKYFRDMYKKSIMGNGYDLEALEDHRYRHEDALSSLLFALQTFESADEAKSYLGDVYYMVGARYPCCTWDTVTELFSAALERKSLSYFLHEFREYFKACYGSS